MVDEHPSGDSVHTACQRGGVCRWDMHTQELDYQLQPRSSVLLHDAACDLDRSSPVLPHRHVGIRAWRVLASGVQHVQLRVCWGKAGADDGNCSLRELDRRVGAGPGNPLLRHRVRGRPVPVRQILERVCCRILWCAICYLDSRQLRCSPRNSVLDVWLADPGEVVPMGDAYLHASADAKRVLHRSPRRHPGSVRLLARAA
mmetsp:Transcript_6403/g.22892  ORF Transcript_6403/g.22892 Transcript_6403/m.22892 type:complete len:201 (+) Transcript_6403:241-843(+)